MGETQIKMVIGCTDTPLPMWELQSMTFVDVNLYVREM